MARLIYSSRALEDLERIADFLLEIAPSLALQAVDLVEEAVTVLKRHPYIGREVEHGMRELVISHGASGYLALYDYLPGEEVLIILAIRHQREAGYPAP